MKPSIIFLLTLSFLVGCDNTAKKIKESNNSDKFNLGSRSNRHIGIKTIESEELKKSGCFFISPDTSVSGIIIGNAESSTKVIGSNSKLDSLEQYNFYTKHDRETLTLIQHSGDVKNQISIFKVSYSDKSDYGYKQLSVDTLVTETGIKLGLTKQQVIDKLGRCYAIIDSSKNNIVIYYSIELPNDTNTKLLKRHNMPIYFAIYKFINDKLGQFEFGFEYP